MQDKLTDAQVAILNKPLPPEAIKPHPTKSYLSTINAIFVTERLNECFGAGGWNISHEIIEHGEKMVVLRGVMLVPALPWFRVEQFGGNDNADKGDAFKGAATDCLTKIGSYLGIGAHVWKDKKSKTPEANLAAKPTATLASATAAIAKAEKATTRDELSTIFRNLSKDLQDQVSPRFVELSKKFTNGAVHA